MDPASDNTTNLASHYECPVCYEYVRPPIYQCQNGHSVCSNCSPKLECCPTCKGQLGVSRALFMEKMLDSVLFPCKYSSKGCKVTLLLAQKDAHEENCSFFLPYSCFVCNWKGAVERVVTHFQQDHHVIGMIQGNHLIYFFKKAELISPMGHAWKINCILHSCFDHHFLFVLLKKKKTNSKFVFFVTSILLTGSQDSASKFTYKIKLKGRQHKKIWESTPLSIQEIPSMDPAPASFMFMANYGSRLFDSTTSHLFSVDNNISFRFEIVQSPVF